MGKTTVKSCAPVCAEELGHYWQTSKKSPNAWLEKDVRALLAKHGAQKVSAGIITGDDVGAVIVGFSFGGRVYKIIQPVLPSRTGNVYAAQVQAATILHHYIKALLLRAKTVGIPSAFVQHQIISGGQTMAEIGDANASSYREIAASAAIALQPPRDD